MVSFGCAVFLCEAEVFVFDSKKTVLHNFIEYKR